MKNNREIGQYGIYEMASKKSEVAFTPEFDQWAENHPNVIRKVAHMIDQMIKKKKKEPQMEVILI